MFHVELGVSQRGMYYMGSHLKLSKLSLGSEGVHMLLSRGYLLILLPSKENSLQSWLMKLSDQLSHTVACSTPLWSMRGARDLAWAEHSQRLQDGGALPSLTSGMARASHFLIYNEMTVEQALCSYIG